MATNVNLPFPEAELQRRVSELQDRMRAKDVEVLLVYTPENMYYLAGYQTTGYYIYQCLIVPVDQDPIMIHRRLEVANVTHGSIIKRHEGFGDIQDPVELTGDALKKYGLANKRIGSEEDSWFLTVADHAKTRSLLPQAKWVDAHHLVEEGRVIKSPLEIETMREGAGIVAKGMQAAYDAAQVGRTEAYVAGKVADSLISDGSVYWASQPYISSGYRTGIAHSSWTLRKLENNEPIFLEISACVKRYTTALMRTMYLGTPSDEHRRMAEASLAGLNAAIGAIKPGAASADVDRACRTAIAKTGFGDRFTHRTGYSIGVGFPPGWGEGHIMDLKPEDPRVLQEGMTFHLVPGMRKEGEVGVGYSETVLVTKDGCESLTKDSPREFYVKS